MQFRQNGQRDERRRRVLRDELATPPSPEDVTPNTLPPENTPKIPARGYSVAVSVESQPPISSLIATRPWTLTVLALAGLSVIAGLEAAYANIFHGSGLPAEVTAALDVAARGSLASWFSSVLLALAAVNAALVYWLRSHKLDDYRGRYRVWLWTTLGLGVAAVDAGSGLHGVVGYLIADRFETPWLQHATVNAVVVLMLVYGSLAVRLGFEIWSSRLATSWFFVAAVGYATAIVIRLELLAIDSVPLTAMAESSALLVANLAVALTVAGSCRYVHLESQGALKPRRQRPKKQAAGAPSQEAEPAPGNEAGSATAKQAAKQATKQATKQPAVAAAPETTAQTSASSPAQRTLRTATIDAKSIRCDSPHQSRGEVRPASTAPANVKPAVTAAQSVAPDDQSEDADDISDFDPETGERLSKSERRRMRKLMRRQKKTGSG